MLNRQAWWSIYSFILFGLFNHMFCISACLVILLQLTVCCGSVIQNTHGVGILLLQGLEKMINNLPFWVRMENGGTSVNAEMAALKSPF